MFSRIQITILIILASLTLFVWNVIFRSPAPQVLEVSVLDVGQGDGIFIEAPNGVQMLMDGGPGKKILSELGSIMPMNDRTLDIVIATHTDLDHIGGLVEVLKRYEVKKIVVNGFEADTDIARSFENVVKEKHIEKVTATAGDRIELDKEIFFDIVSPTKEDFFPISQKSNEVMIMGKLTYGEDSFFFTGDVERSDELRLVQSGYFLESDVLKVAHHGSKYSSTDLFLERVRPKYAVISVGENNRYGHPTEQTLARLSRVGAAVFRTDKEGRIKFLSSSKGIEVRVK